MHALAARGLTVFYGKVGAVREASLAVPEGGIVTLIGPNGAGKTSLLLALMGLLPSEGTVTYGGEAIGALDVESRVGLGLCLVPERRELFGEMSVADNLALGGFARRSASRQERHRALEEVYARFPRLRERRRQHANTLSGGERQMVALGRALMAGPKVLMLDEPSLGLAPLVTREIFRIIADLRQSGVSILLVEQNARAALEIADYGYVLENGRISLEGPARDLAGDSHVVDSYLGRRPSGPPAAPRREFQPC